MSQKGAEKPELPKEFLRQLEAITAKRAKTVIDHILKHGLITTEELSTIYGYDHPPRAARDVREEGIPLETFRITGSRGKKIAAYRFGNPSNVKSDRAGGRKIWPKKFKENLVKQHGSRCGICMTVYEPRHLQIDHRVPFEIAGDSTVKMNVENFMLLCGSCNRAKSWSCEHCMNWTTDRLIAVCQTCYWAVPEGYAHIALEIVRRVDVVWKGKELSTYSRLAEMAKLVRKDLPEFVKEVLNRHAHGSGDNE